MGAGATADKMPKRRRVAAGGADDASETSSTVKEEVSEQPTPSKGGAKGSGRQNGVVARKGKDAMDEESPSTSSGASDHRIVLNVGGKRFETYSTTLARHPKSILASMYLSVLWISACPHAFDSLCLRISPCVSWLITTLAPLFCS